MFGGARIMSIAFEVDDVVPAAAGLSTHDLRLRARRRRSGSTSTHAAWGRRPCWRTPGQAAGKSFVPAVMRKEDVRRAAAGVPAMMPCQLGVEFYSDPEASDPLNGGSTAEAKRHGERHETDAKGQNIFERARLRTFASCSAAKEALS